MGGAPLSTQNFCKANDISCILYDPLCSLVTKDPKDLVFRGSITQTILRIFNSAWSHMGGFCGLPKLKWDPHFMVLEGDWKGLINNINSEDVSGPFMVGFDTLYNRLFLTVKTSPSVVTTFFQQENAFSLDQVERTWFISEGREGPFESFFPYCSNDTNCLNILEELVEEGSVTISLIPGASNSSSGSRVYYLDYT